MFIFFIKKINISRFRFLKSSIPPSAEANLIPKLRKNFNFLKLLSIQNGDIVTRLYF